MGPRPDFVSLARHVQWEHKQGAHPLTINSPSAHKPTSPAKGLGIGWALTQHLPSTKKVTNHAINGNVFSFTCYCD